MAYDRSSINNFVQKQGGSLSNLGASPTYTGTSSPQMGQNQMNQNRMQQPQNGMQNHMRQQTQQQPQQQPVAPPQYQGTRFAPSIQSLGQQRMNEQALYQQAMANRYNQRPANNEAALRNAVMKERIQMMMQQRGMGNINRLGVR